MKIGFTEIIVIFIVALIVIGPDKLPFYAKRLGAGLREFRKATDDMTKDIRESVVEPLEEAQKPIREAMEPFEQLDRDVRNNFKESFEMLLENTLNVSANPLPNNTDVINTWISEKTHNKIKSMLKPEPTDPLDLYLVNTV